MILVIIETCYPHGFRVTIIAITGVIVINIP